MQGKKSRPRRSGRFHTDASASTLLLPSFAGSGSALRVLPAACHRLRTWDAPLAAGGSIPRSAHLNHFLDQLRPQLVHLLIHHRFNLCPRRLGVLFPPSGHPQHVSQSCADLLHLWASLPFVLLAFHSLASLLVFFLLFYQLPPVCKKMKLT